MNGDRSTNGDRPLLRLNGLDQGAIPRNIGKGPSFATFDMRLTKKIGFSETTSLDLTIEAFNLLNRLNFSSVNNTVGAFFPTTVNVAGTTPLARSAPLGFTSAFDARRIQLGAKFRF